MDCPNCGSGPRLSVTKTRHQPDGAIERIRRCGGCGRSFSTFERFAETALHVRKSDSSIVPFAAGRLRKSIERALVRRPREEKFRELIGNVVTTAYAVSEHGVVDSFALGDAVLSELKRRDEVSHIRFALVHIGRRDRRLRDGSAPAHPDDGWTEASQVRRWLLEQYPWLTRRAVPGALTTVVKRDGRREAYDRQKLERSIGFAAKGREGAAELRERSVEVAAIVEAALFDQPMVTSGQIAAEILRVFRGWDHIAYLRFASTAKGFDSPEDFAAEAVALLRVPQREPGTGGER